MKKKNSVFIYYVIYTLMFFAIASVVFYPFYAGGRSFIWKTDGMPQYFLWLKYTRTYLRQAIKSVLHGNFHLKMYDFSIGMGSDIRYFFNMDPVNLLSVFIPNGYSLSKAYTYFQFLRFYLTGFTFSAYGLYMSAQKRKKAGVGYPNAAILAGALIYTFNSYMFYQVGRHPQFAVATYMLPLLLIGLEQVIEKKNVLFFSLCVGIILMGTYYFLYMCTGLMGFYALIRLFDHYDHHRIREFIFMVFRIILSYLLGCGLTLVCFIPAITSFFVSSRFSNDGSASFSPALLSYGKDRILELFVHFVEPSFPISGATTFSVSAFGLLAVILLFTKRNKEKRTLKLSFILSLIFLMIPAIAYVFSAFGAISNRWAFGFIMIISIIIMTEFEQFFTFSRFQYIFMIAVALIHTALCFVFYAKDTYLLFASLVLWGAVGITGLLRILAKKDSIWIKRSVSAAICICIALTNMYFGYYFYQKNPKNYIKKYQSEATSDTYFRKSRFHYLAQIEDDSFYRTDTDLMNYNYQNTSVALGYSGISLYNSTVPSPMVAYYNESESIGISAVNRTSSMDNRTSQEALACVKYFITKKGSTQTVPYGFEPNTNLAANSKTYEIYENKYVLPLGYTYGTTMARSDYNQLSALEKQQIQMKVAVLDDEDISAISQAVPKEEQIDLSTEITQGTIQLETNEKGTSFTTQVKKGCEVYLRFVNLKSTNPKLSTLKVTTDQLSKKAYVRSKKDIYKVARDSYLFNLGYYDQDETIQGQITLGNGKNNTFYSWDDIEVYYVSMESYQKDLESLQASSLENIRQDTNTISGNVTSTENQIMTFSIPYHKGWKVYVDEKPVTTLQVNTMYLGILLAAGSHDIRLEYASPGLELGAYISMGAWALYLLILLIWLIKKGIKVLTRH